MLPPLTEGTEGLSGNTVMDRRSTLFAVSILVLSCLVACSSRKEPAKYPHINEARRASLTQEAHERGIDPNDWLDVVNLRHELDRFPKESPTSEEWEVIRKTMSSNHAILRQTSLGALSRVLTAEQRKEADTAIMRMATADQDSSVRVVALMHLYRSNHPDWRMLVQAELGKSPPEATAQICQDMLKGTVARRPSQ